LFFISFSIEFSIFCGRQYTAQILIIYSQIPLILYNFFVAAFSQKFDRVQFSQYTIQQHVKPVKAFHFCKLTQQGRRHNDLLQLQLAANRKQEKSNFLAFFPEKLTILEFSIF